MGLLWYLQVPDHYIGVLAKKMLGGECSTMFSDVPGQQLLVSNTVPVSINFLCHKRIEGRDGGSLPYLLL